MTRDTRRASHRALRWAGLALTATTATAGLAACSTGSPGATGSAAPTPTSATSPPAAGTVRPNRVAVARTLLAQYDYAGARAALAGDASPEARAALTAVAAAERAARPWPDNATISHIFFHSLVVDPGRAFHAGAMSQGYLDYMVTEREFRAQLEALHRKGFVLVHATDIATKDAAGTMRYRPIVLPPGKTPLVLSIDDTSYYEYMAGAGFASRLVTRPGGRVLTEYTDAAGRTTVGSHDVMPIVDDFVRAHPDFSYHGHKGTMALTGYNGVLGYRTSARTYGDTPATRRAAADATRVAAAMKRNGWLFASHTWGHLDATKSSLQRLTGDADRWDAEVRPIIGPTPQLIFAFGADISDTRPYTPANDKYRMLQQRGFDYIFPIDASRTSWLQLSGGSLRQARINIDGISMTAALRRPTGVIRHFFDPAAVWDPARSGGPTRATNPAPPTTTPRAATPSAGDRAPRPTTRPTAEQSRPAPAGHATEPPITPSGRSHSPTPPAPAHRG